MRIVAEFNEFVRKILIGAAFLLWLGFCVAILLLPVYAAFHFLVKYW